MFLKLDYCFNATFHGTFCQERSPEITYTFDLENTINLIRIFLVNQPYEDELKLKKKEI